MTEPVDPPSDPRPDDSSKARRGGLWESDRAAAGRRGAGEAPPRPLDPSAPVRERARTPFRWLRRFLLVIGIGGTIAVGILIAAYNFGRSTEPEAEAPVGDPDEKTVSTLVDYVQTSGGERVFRVRADRSVQTEDDVSKLEGVILDLFGQNGSVYSISSRLARVDRGASEAEFEGDVEVSGWENLRLASRSLSLAEGGDRLQTPGQVELLWDDPSMPLVGRAASMRIDRQADVITLTGGVEIRNREGAPEIVRLDCDRLVYDRGQGLIRAMEGVYLRWGDRELRTRALTVFLQPDGKTFKLIRARWEVRARVADRLLEDDAPVEQRPSGDEAETAVASLGPQPSDVVTLRGELLEIEPNAENPDYQKVTLDGVGQGAVSVRLQGADGLTRTLTGARFTAGLLEGQLVLVDGTGGPAELVETFGGAAEPTAAKPLRRALARQMRVTFDIEGELSRIDLVGDVDLIDGDVRVRQASNANLDALSGTLALDGQPVEMTTDRGELLAPTVRYNRERGILRASGGVQAALEPTSAQALASTPFGSGEGPIRVQAEEAVWSDDPRTFAFEGGVRAWRGTNLLLAERLRGEDATQEMSATGGVHTEWHPLPTPTDPAPQALEVDAEMLTYREGLGELIYRGDVRVEREERKLRCEALQVDLEEGGSRARSMACTGDVRLLDPVGGQDVRGDRALYDLTKKQVEVFGDPVDLKDGSGNQLKGKYLLYDVGSGRTRLKARVPEDVESAAPGTSPPAGSPTPIDGAPAGDPVS